MRACVWLIAALSLVSASAVQAGVELVARPARPSPRDAIHRAAETLRALDLRVVASLSLGDHSAPIVLLEARDSASALRALAKLGADTAFEWIEPNLERLPAVAPESLIAADPTFPSDPMFRDGRQWGLTHVRAQEAWSSSCGSPAILLAVADTGIDPDHPELRQLLSDGRDRLERGVNVAGEAVDAVADSFGHGMPVAGVMAARTNEGVHFDSLGVAGVCGGNGVDNPGCRLMPIKISRGNTGMATSFAIADAIVLAARHGARAVNISFAGGGPSVVERLAMREALRQGCVVVAASGNQGARNPGAPQYPAAYAADGLGIQVGASDRFDRRAAFSSHGPGLDLVAPGVDIWTTWMTYANPNGVPGRGYASVSGTSFATPFVTGAVGLLAAARPELRDVDFQHILRETAHDIEAQGPDSLTGWGRLDIGAALRTVGPDMGIWHDEVAADAMVSAGFDSLWIGEGGLGNLDRWRGVHWAERIEISASVALPDSFVDSVRVWARVLGTTSLRGDFRLPYFAPRGEARAASPRHLTLRGHLYRIHEHAAAGNTIEPDDCFVPLPPDQSRFAFTVIGRVDRRHPEPKPALPDPNGWVRVSPNPSRGRARIEGPAGAEVTIVDLSGRRIASGRIMEGRFEWDGRDDHGRSVPHGLYFVRVGGAAAVKLVTIE